MEKLNLNQKLVEIRKCIGVLQKTENGNQGARYVDPAVILLKIRNAMDKHGVLLSCSITKSDVTQIPMPTAKNSNNTGYLSKNQLNYTWRSGTETLECPWFAVGKHMSDPAMAFGGALTYAERYFLLKFFQIPTTKDDPEYLRQKSGEPEPSPIKPELVPGVPNWDHAIAAYKRDGNFVAIEKRVVISDENKEKIKAAVNEMA